MATEVRGGSTDKLPNIFVLAPKHAALTTQEQPALFWFQTGPASAGFELTLTKPKDPAPLLNLKAGAGNKMPGFTASRWRA